MNWARDKEGQWRDLKGRPVSAWYRGTARTQYKLQPSFYRSLNGTHCDNEQSLFIGFRIRGRAFRDRPLTSLWEPYYLAQHYGMPTRLLDWTRGVLVAAFFALEEEFRSSEFTYERVQQLADQRVWKFHELKEGGDAAQHRKPPFARPTVDLDVLRAKLEGTGDACVWMLHAESVNEAFRGDDFVYHPRQFSSYWLPGQVNPGQPIDILWDGKGYNNKYPIAIDPELFDARMIAQRAVFTCHGADTNSLEDLAAEHHAVRLARIAIPSDWKVVVWHQLWIAGVTRDVIFPELASIASVLTQESWVKKP